MIFSQSTAYSEHAARYMIAQHVPDAFRKETTNVGVVVEKGGEFACQFIGEKEPGRWDSSKLRKFGNPNNYKLWVDQWRKIVTESNGDWIDNLAAECGADFSVVFGGDLTDTGADAPEEICRFLFSALVSKGGLYEALSGEEDDAFTVLKNDVRSTFRDHKILSSATRARNPVYVDHLVMGTKSYHTVSFYQETRSEAWAMEPIDFTTANKRQARNQACFAKCTFSDILARDRTKERTVHTIALVRSTAEDRRNPDVEKGYEFLADSCTIVDWSSKAIREEFVAQLVDTADAA